MRRLNLISLQRLLLTSALVLLFAAHHSRAIRYDWNALAASGTRGGSGGSGSSQTTATAAPLDIVVVHVQTFADTQNSTLVKCLQSRSAFLPGLAVSNANQFYGATGSADCDDL